MDENRKLLLSLLRIGLGCDDAIEMSAKHSVSASRIFQLAKEQIVMGIVAAGIEKAVANGLKLDSIGFDQISFLKFIGVRTKIETKNKQINQALVEIYGKFQGKSLYPILLKGQVAALQYPKPMSRQSGDIDFFFVRDAGYRAINEVKARDVKITHELFRDFAFVFNGVDVEIPPLLVHSRHSDTRKKVFEAQIAGVPVINHEENSKTGDRPQAVSKIDNENPVRIWIDIRINNGLHLSQKNLSYRDLARMVENLEVLC